MRKRLISITLLVLMLSLSGCSKKETKEEPIVKAVIEETDGIKTEVTEKKEIEEVAEPVEEGETLYATTNVNVRTGSNVEMDKLGMLNKNEEVKRTGTEGEWSIIIYKGGVGYVATKYLSTEKIVDSASSEKNTGTVANDKLTEKNSGEGTRSSSAESRAKGSNSSNENNSTTNKNTANTNTGSSGSGSNNSGNTGNSGTNNSNGSSNSGSSNSGNNNSSTPAPSIPAPSQPTPERTAEEKAAQEAARREQEAYYAEQARIEAEKAEAERQAQLAAEAAAKEEAARKAAAEEAERAYQEWLANQ